MMRWSNLVVGILTAIVTPLTSAIADVCPYPAENTYFTIEFGNGSSSIGPEGWRILNQIRQAYPQGCRPRVLLIGHVDGDEVRGGRLDLESQRVNAVEAALIENVKVEAGMISRRESIGTDYGRPVIIHIETSVSGRLVCRPLNMAIEPQYGRICVVSPKPGLFCPHASVTVVPPNSFAP